MMRRYLICFSYIGTFYRGLAKQESACYKDLMSVQGVLQEALQKYFCNKELTIYPSSRTDKGVHALINTAHFDVLEENDVKYDPENITKSINEYLINNSHDIILQKTTPVPNYFCSRSQIKFRTYLYRLAVIQMEKPNESLNTFDFIPFMELNRCHLIRQPFCAKTFMKSAETLSGLHDFETFMQKSTDNKITPRRIELWIEGGKQFLPLHNPLYDDLILYDVMVKSRSFLYKQVRRMVGAMVSSAQGRITVEDIKWMLENPSLKNWNSKIPVLPPYGLFLKSIVYKQISNSDVSNNDEN